MKKIYCVITILLISIFLVSCKKKDIFRIVIIQNAYDDEIISKFIKEYPVEFEIFFSDPYNPDLINQIENGEFYPDLILADSYSISKLQNRDLLAKIDRTKLSNYKQENFDPFILNILNNYYEGSSDYLIPYSWTTLSIAYNQTNQQLENQIRTNGWRILFDNSLLPSETKYGFSNSPRDVIGTALLSLDYDLNTSNEEELNDVENFINTTPKYGISWDILDKIYNNEIDIGLVRTADFFASMAFAMQHGYIINYNVVTPEENILFINSIAMTKETKYPKLCLAIIDLLLAQHYTTKTGLKSSYAPAMTDVYDRIIDLYNPVSIIRHESFYPLLKEGYIYTELDEATKTKYQEIFDNLKRK